MNHNDADAASWFGQLNEYWNDTLQTPSLLRGADWQGYCRRERTVARITYAMSAELTIKFGSGEHLYAELFRRVRRYLEEFMPQQVDVPDPLSVVDKDGLDVFSRVVYDHLVQLRHGGLCTCAACKYHYRETQAWIAGIGT